VSRGFGRWQRSLLVAVEKYDVVPVADVGWDELGREPSRTEMVALRRAARTLAEGGQLLARYLICCDRCGELGVLFRCCGHRGYVLVVTRRADLKGFMPKGRPAG